MKEHSDLSVLPAHIKEELLETVLDRIRIQEDKQYGDSYCWLWTQHLDRGYGKIRLYDSSYRRVHRAFYQLLVGPIPEGLQVDHLCRVKSCCNPEHLEPVSSRINTLRGTGTSAINARKRNCGVCGGPFHCVKRSGTNRLQRKCKICMRREARTRMAKKRAALKAQKKDS